MEMRKESRDKLKFLINQRNIIYNSIQDQLQASHKLGRSKLSNELSNKYGSKYINDLIKERNQERLKNVIYKLQSNKGSI